LAKYLHFLRSGIVIPVPKFHVMEVFIILSKTANILPLALDFLTVFMLSITLLEGDPALFQYGAWRDPMDGFYLVQKSRASFSSLVTVVLYKASHITNMLQLVQRNLLFVNNKNNPVQNTVNPNFAFSMILCTFCTVSAKCP